MQREEKKYLYDIWNCISQVNGFLGDNPLFETFNQNLMLQQAIERNLEIIGEAVNNLLKLQPEINITDARKMVDTRNKIIHSYDQVNPRQIWNIIINHLPLLKIEVGQLLES